MVTPREVFEGLYRLAESNPATIFLIAVLVPSVGVTLALVGRGGRTDEDGRVIANVLVLVAVIQFVVAMVVGYVGVAFLERSLFDADFLLLAAPWVWLVLTLGGVRRVFPLNDLASWHSVRDVAGFFAVCAAFVWFLSMFRGWGIFFIGSLVELLIIVVLGGLLIRQLFLRAFRGGA